MNRWMRIAQLLQELFSKYSFPVENASGEGAKWRRFVLIVVIGLVAAGFANSLIWAIVAIVIAIIVR